MVGFNKKTVKDVDLAGKVVLLRADYNVPLKDGRIVDDYRLKASLPTLKYVLEKKAQTPDYNFSLGQARR